MAQETKRHFLILAVTVCLFGGLLFVGTLKPQGQVEGAFITFQANAQLPVLENIQVRRLPNFVEFPSPGDLTARAAMIKDRQSGQVLFEKNSDLELPIASLTKLMTAIVVWQHTFGQGIVQIFAADENVPPTLSGLVPGERVTVADLLKAMLVHSGNDAAMALGRYTGGTAENFVQMMNGEAQQLGMKNTVFANPVGFDAPNHYSTAFDLSLLVDEFLRHPQLAGIVREKNAVISSVDGTNRAVLPTTNELLLKHDDVVGIKTGYTSAAGGNLIILTDQPSTNSTQTQGYYSILLGSKNREKETESLMNWTKENFSWE